MLRKLLGGVALASLFSSPALSAHEQFRIIGKIVKFDKWRLDVETPDGETFLIRLQVHANPARQEARHGEGVKNGRERGGRVSADTPYDADRYVDQRHARPRHCSKAREVAP